MPEYVVCNLCGQNRTQIIQKAEEPYQVVKCLHCGLVYTNPQPALNTIGAHYQETYYRDWIDKQMDRRIRMWKKRLKDVQKLKPSGNILDVGCGIGTFLNLARESGYDVQGTEISEFGSKYVQEKLGIDVFQGDVKDVRFPTHYFDIVTLWHTLEHVPDPSSLLKEINRILKPDGLLVIAVPNVHNFITKILYFLARRRKLKLFSISAKEWHFTHFSSRTLSAMLKKTEFEITKTELDLSQIEPSKKTIDCLARIVHTVTGKNFGEALKIYASKI
ncbi:MAG: class I SAM-dependent methyltransferase [Candidatus Aminicenantes bacterium]|nr:class I SAM-dependent methyltransferase [Candidatus Aminicenantes bacterium]